MKYFWKNKKVLITGADGFVGSHLAEKLIDLGDLAGRDKVLIWKEGDPAREVTLLAQPIFFCWCKQFSM